MITTQKALHMCLDRNICVAFKTLLKVISLIHWRRINFKNIKFYDYFGENNHFYGFPENS